MLVKYNSLLPRTSPFVSKASHANSEIPIFNRCIVVVLWEFLFFLENLCWPKQWVSWNGRQHENFFYEWQKSFQMLLLLDTTLLEKLLRTWQLHFVSKPSFICLCLPAWWNNFCSGRLWHFPLTKCHPCCSQSRGTGDRRPLPADGQQKPHRHGTSLQHWRSFSSDFDMQRSHQEVSHSARHYLQHKQNRISVSRHWYPALIYL